MKLNKKVKIIVFGTIIGFATVSPSPINHTSAEEIAITGNSAELKTIEIEEFQLDQIFTPDEKTYTANVANNIKSMSLLLNTKEESASVTINGEAIVKGEKTILPLETGENIFAITITNGTNENVYTITIIRAQNDNNQLANLTLSSGKIQFVSEITSYDVKVDNEVSKITIKPEVAVETSTIQINGESIKEEGYLVELPVGTTTITTIVTAENGSKRTYTLTISRAKEEIEKPEKEPESNGDSKSSTTVKETESNDKAEAPTTVQKPSSKDIQQKQSTTHQTGQYNSANFLVASTNSGGSGATLEESSKANLHSLTISDGDLNKSFSSDVYTYHIDIENNVTNVTITANPMESDAELLIDDHDVSGSRKVTLEDKTRTIISVVVTHENDRKTYVLVFDKDINTDETKDNTKENVFTKDSNEAQVQNTSTEEVSLPESTKSLPSENQMSMGLDRSSESTSLWQKVLSFFGF